VSIRRLLHSQSLPATLQPATPSLAATFSSSLDRKTFSASIPLSFRQHRRRAQIPIALLPHQSPAAALVPYLPTRFRALALFGRRSPERVVRSSLPAAENLHRSGCEQSQQGSPYSITSSAPA